MTDEIWKPEEYMAYHKLVFREMFNFLNANFPPGTDPEWWKQFSEDMTKTSENAHGGPLVNGILTAIADYLEEEYKKRR